MRTLTPILLLISTALLFACSKEETPAPAPADGNTSLGAVVKPVTLRFDVDGMTCGNCEDAITTTLLAMEGVSECQASHAEKTATVTVTDPALSGPIVDAITDLGFTAEPSA